jgi:hypothetical protein
VLRSDWEDGELQSHSVAATQLRNHLNQEFYIPSWFWEKQGWDANGFFASKECPIKDANVETSHCEYFIV